MEVFDKDGNPVEGVMTQAEVDAKLATEKASWEEANKKPDTPPAPSNEVPEWFKPFADKVDALSGNQRSMVVKNVAETLDADKRTQFDAKFNNLTGYGETLEELQRRAQDAYLLTTGQTFESQAINMQNIAASGGSPVRPSALAPELDKAFCQAFGITEADVAKYGNK